LFHRTKKPAKAGFFYTRTRAYFLVVSVVVVVVVLFDASLLPVVVLEDGVLDMLDEPLGVVVVLVPPGVVVVLALPEGVVVVVVEEVEDEPDVDASAGLVVSAGFTSTLVEEDDEGGVLVSVLEQPTTPTPTARMAARRYDDFIFRVPSSVVVQEAHWPLRDAALRNGPSGEVGQPAILAKSRNRFKTRVISRAPKARKVPRFRRNAA